MAIDDNYVAGKSAYGNIPQGYKARAFIGTDNTLRTSWGKNKYSVAYYATSVAWASDSTQVNLTDLITSTKLLNAYSKVVVTPTTQPSGSWWIDKNTGTGVVLVKSTATEASGTGFDVFISNNRIY